MNKSTDLMRFLGLAFASADLLFEVEPSGVIAFAVGAARKVTGVDNVVLPQSSWRVLFEPSDHGLFEAMIDGLDEAGRKGPVRCRIRDVPGKPARYANVFACRLPQLAPNVSCALSMTGDVIVEAPDGLLDRTAFDAAISGLLRQAQESGLDVELALIEVAGLAKALQGLTVEAGGTVVDGLSDVLRAEALGGAASQLRDEQFALVREKPEGVDSLSGRLKAAAANRGATVEPRTSTVSLDGGADPQTLRALRFTLDTVLHDPGLRVDLGDVFRSSLEATLERARVFTETVKARQFKLVYQPIIDLKTRATHHYEALARFPGEDSPEDTIRMAEELDLIEMFDLAVAEKAISMLRSHGPDVRIAVNVSGRSFLRPKFLDRLLALTAGDIRLKTRLLFEITESAALVNLELADERIQRLRRDGFPVCIDDFGAGAASLAYLRSLTVDTIKIDGQYIQQIEGGGREGAVVKHLAALCRDIGVKTIAEMVETKQAVDLLTRYGVDMGQGYIFSKPLEHIPVAAPPVQKRRGAVETWG
jgi:EAL domain-containing protein (putative c-di-GMP-specific phosphodiesterase class I)